MTAARENHLVLGYSQQEYGSAELRPLIEQLRDVGGKATRLLGRGLPSDGEFVG
jgi:hypothetical protein